jgi:PleD family two-component response regulator
VLFTCHDDDVIAEKALKVGADECCVKSQNLSSFNVLAARVRDLVSRRKLAEGLDMFRLTSKYNHLMIHYLKA